MFQKNLTIKKGNKGLLRFPTFLHDRAVFIFELEVTAEMLTMCNDGWSKVLGIAYRYHHWNSVRLVHRPGESFIYFGYYLYAKDESPQEDQAQKSHLAKRDSYIMAKPGDIIKFKITPYSYRTDVLIEQFRSLILIDKVEATLDPMNRRWPIYMLEPHHKCPVKNDTTYQIKLF